MGDFSISGDQVWRRWKSHQSTVLRSGSDQRKAKVGGDAAGANRKAHRNLPSAADKLDFGFAGNRKVDGVCDVALFVGDNVQFSGLDYVVARADVDMRVQHDPGEAALVVRVEHRPLRFIQVAHHGNPGLSAQV